MFNFLVCNINSRPQKPAVLLPIGLIRVIEKGRGKASQAEHFVSIVEFVAFLYHSN